MLVKIADSIWNFFVAWGEMKYEFHKRHNFKSWY